MTSENISIELCEIVNLSIENPHLETTEFGFTRYLYIIDDVKSSLVIAILERNIEEALFWAYELYFSGFKDDVFCILEQMVDMMYISLNPRLGPFLEKKKREWIESGSYCIVGTFIYNMIIRQYDVSDFVKKFCKDPELITHINEKQIIPKQTEQPVKNMAKNIYITIEQKDVLKYITINHIKPHKLLRQTVKYQVRQNTLAIFDHQHGIYKHEQIQSLYWYHWLYYANKSPIWVERISIYGGKLNHESYSVDFDTEDLKEAFYDKYGLEPDEQPKQLQEMNIGTGLEEQMSWTEFYEKYASK
jgi:hypothetical protein